MFMNLMIDAITGIDRVLRGAPNACPRHRRS